MKSRRHRAIDISNKDIPMNRFQLKKGVAKKVLTEAFKKSSRIYYKSMV